MTLTRSSAHFTTLERLRWWPRIRKQGIEIFFRQVFLQDDDFYPPVLRSSLWSIVGRDRFGVGKSGRRRM